MRILANATYICHESSHYNILSNEMRLEEAEKLVRLYAKARFVVTGRIHCALPCLGLETPVYFTYDNAWNEASTCRFGGLLELLHVINVTPNRIRADFDFPANFPIDLVANKDSWKPLAKRMTEKCRDFFARTE